MFVGKYPQLEITGMLKEIEFMSATNIFEFRYLCKKCNRAVNWLAVRAKITAKQSMLLAGSLR